MGSSEFFETMAVPFIIATLLAGITLVAITPSNAKTRIRGIALASTLAAFLIGVAMFLRFDWDSSEWQFTFDVAWIPSIGAQVSFGVDGISLPLLLLTLFLGPLCVLVSIGEIEERVKEFHICLLLIEAALVGVFTARDLLLFYTF